ncbi:hypothetical protein IE81DRAFT_127452 [Ceraceosorus guamensis]|uniref:M-phase inducer phosphatase n=1 Tax=Ceraceosorus guamensis TaxID=1522189 RepID=A0A316W7H3_9BASI|nr:hypothetical protein IE81DRAFT_127452 [Ceraceosorus guamensis]PWN45827.1 hypothetical protein IE81DRAFT_127452 [Ceraceosorus guamensis]
MTTLLSSPIGAPIRLDNIFQQPSSPTRKYDDLPAEFGDRSFGSSMSLSSSFDLGRYTNERNSNTHQSVSPSNSFASHMRMAVSSNSAKAGPSSAFLGHARPEKHHHQSLGEAMGTELHSRSPNLGMKLTSPHRMEVDTSIEVPDLPHKRSAILRSARQQGSGLNDQRNIREETVRNPRSRRSSPTSSASKPNSPAPLAAQRTSPAGLQAPAAPGSAGGSLGRMFGMELRLNSGEDESALNSSPDKEPPTKRRPSSLPLGGGDHHTRPSMRSAGLMPSSTARPSMIKHQSLNTSSGVVPRKRGSMEVLGQTRSISDANAAQIEPRLARTRAHSAELQVTKSTRAPISHATIIESPSPSTIAHEGLGSYFFDPSSPEHLANVKGNAPAAKLRASPKLEEPPMTARPTLRPGLGDRLFERTATSAEMPTFARAMDSDAATGPSGRSRSSLGKRANPYSKRPSLAPLAAARDSQMDGGLRTAYPTLGGQARLTAPAPRRCHSALDNTKVFASAATLRPTMMKPSDMASPDAERSLSFPEEFDVNGSPVAHSARPRSRPAFLRRTSKDDASPLGYGSKRSGSNGDHGFSMQQSPMAVSSPKYGAECMPGFGASEMEGKILPCHTSKDDGLMRISSDTLADLQSGKYATHIKEHFVIDCRFGYEFDGGHVGGAINLSTIEKVKAYFLTPGQGLHADRPMPPRSQSGASSGTQPDKTVLIFHCEFSAKRAPSLALALRHADRALRHDYPSCHFPELYVLEGGYCGFFKEHPLLCEPVAYVEMDDPAYSEQRSSEICGFRKQFAPKQPFNRHRSFTFGERSSSAGGAPVRSLANGLAHSIREEDTSCDDSPSAAVAGGVHARKKLMQPAKDRARGGERAALSPGAGDMSLCSSVGDSSFEGGPSDSPCAAVPARRPAVAGGALPKVRLGAPRPLQRASTASNVLGR